MSLLMQCGCAANARDKDGKPVCAAHIGIVVGADIPADPQPNLAERKAQCVYCKIEVESDLNLSYFQSGRWVKGARDETVDSFYCGCRGWE